MKKLAILFILLTASANSQVHLGAKAGANLTKINGSTFKEKFELGYQLGGFIYADLSESIGIQTEVLFNQTNTSVEDRYSEVINNAFRGNKTLNYISVPLLVRLNNEGLVTFTAGPQLSFLADSGKSLTENGKKLFKKTDFSVLAGAELNLHPFIIYARYCWGFSDVSDFGSKASSRQIQLGAALRVF